MRVMTELPGTVYLDNPTLDDRLDRGRVVDRLAEVLIEISATGSSAVVGLTAPWGSGKTSALEALTTQLSDTWEVRKFSAWLPSDAREMAGSLLAEISSVLPTTWLQDKVAKYRERAKELGAAAADLARSGGGAAVELLFGEGTLEERHLRLAEELAQVEKPVLIVVDDADRLQPAELLELFRMIRAVGRLPKVSYLLAYDEETVLRLLRNSDMSGDMHEARAYLEKVVQLRFDLPAVQVEQMRSLFDEALGALLTRVNQTLTTEQQGRLDLLWEVSLRDLVTTPRQSRLLFAQLTAIWPLVENEVDLVDLLAITAVRLTEPDVYSLLRRERELLTGNSARLMLLHGLTDLSKVEKMREDLVETASKMAGTERTHSSAFLIRQLFPLIKKESVPGLLRIGNSSYTDRYFYAGVPTDELADEAIRTALAEIAAHGPGAAMAFANQLASSDHISIVTKLRQYGRDLKRPEAWNAIRWLLSAEVADRLASADSLIASAWLNDLFFLAQPDEGEVDRLVVSSTASLALLMDYADHLGNFVSPEQMNALPWLGALRARVDRDIEATLRTIFGMPTDTAPEWPYFVALRRLAGVHHPDRLRTLMTALPGHDSGGWDILDVAAVFVSRVARVGTTDWRADDLHTNDLLGWIGPEATEALIQAVADEPPQTFTDAPDSANRRIKATETLRALGPEGIRKIAEMQYPETDELEP